MHQVALILPREVPSKFRVMCVSSPALGNNPRWEDPIKTTREALQEAGVPFVELVEDESLAKTLTFPEHRIAVLPFVDMLLPGSFEIIERFIAAGGKVLAQNCYAGEYAWWPDSGFYFNCYVFSLDYRGPLLANIVDYLLTGRTMKPPKPPLKTPRSIQIGFWQSPSLLPGATLAEWDLLPDALILWTAVMNQPRAKVEEQFAQILDSAAARGCKLWLTTHYDHPTPKGFSSYFLQGRTEWLYSPEFVSKLKPATREALQGFVFNEPGTAQLGKCAYFTEATDMRDAEQKFVSSLRPYLQKLRDAGMRRIEIFEASLNHHHNYEAGADVSQLEMGCGSPEPLVAQCAGARGMARAYGRRFVSAISLWYGDAHVGQYAAPVDALWDCLHTSYLCGADEVHLQAEPMGTGLISGSAPRKGRAAAADYEEVLSEFSRWTRTVERRGEPIVSVGILKGNLDAWPGFDTAAGLYGLGRSFHLEQNASGRWEHIHDRWNPAWAMAAPEHGWKVLDLFYPKHEKQVASATPYGLVEILPISVQLDHLSTFRLLILAGWNTMTAEIATKLTGYVRSGGTLLLALPHLSSHKRREDVLEGNYCFDVPEVAQLVGFDPASAPKEPVVENRLGSGTCYCWTARQYPGDVSQLETFTAFVRQLANAHSPFRLHTTGRVAAVPYREKSGAHHVHLVNHETTAQRVTVQHENQSLDIQLGPRDHSIIPLNHA